MSCSAIPELVLFTNVTQPAAPAAPWGANAGMRLIMGEPTIRNASNTNRTKKRKEDEVAAYQMVVAVPVDVPSDSL